MKLALLPLITGLLPVSAAIIAYWTAAGMGHVPLCLPLIEGCTTISSIGRHAPESLLFRATMIPAAVLMMIYWRLNLEWLIINGDRPVFTGWLMVWLGAVAAVFLIIYTVALGFIGDYYSLQRRIGVTLFFSFTYIAQLLLLRRYTVLLQARQWPALLRAYRVKVVICLLMLLMGLIISPLKALYPAHESVIENVIEWNFALLMCLYLIVTAAVWRESGFRAGFHAKDNRSSAYKHAKDNRSSAYKSVR